MDALTWLGIVLACLGGLWVGSVVFVILVIWVARQEKAPVPAAMVLDEMAEQRAPAIGLPCHCIIHLLPDGDSYVRPCRHHSYMRNPDFAAWVTELENR